MAVQLSISYETLIELVEQLPSDQQQDLLVRLLEGTKNRQLSKSEKVALYHASILSVALNETPSIRREDWYGDDGRWYTEAEISRQFGACRRRWLKPIG